MTAPPENIVVRLQKRAAIRRQISTRRSVQEGAPDRIADLLEEAASHIIALEGRADTLQTALNDEAEAYVLCQQDFRRALDLLADLQVLLDDNADVLDGAYGEPVPDKYMSAGNDVRDFLAGVSK